MIVVSWEHEAYREDVVIPAGFFFYELPSLDELSLKCFLLLYATAYLQAGELEESRLCECLQVSAGQLANILRLLEQRGLLKWTEQGVALTDLRKLYQERSTTENSAITTAEQEMRAGVIRQINDTFYSGVMPLPFYNAIERWFQEYHFDAEVVYALFHELKRYQTLHSENYAERIAANWSGRGIRSFSDLNNYHEKRQELNQHAKTLQARLRQSQALSAYQMEFLKRWLQEWNLSFELIDEAFRRASLRKGNLSFVYVEGILKNWYEAGLQTKADVLRYEQEHAEQAYPRERQVTGKSVIGNFTQRRYTAESLDNLYQGLDFLDEEDYAVSSGGGSE